MDNVSDEYLVVVKLRMCIIVYITLKSVTFLNDGTFTRTPSVQGLPVILK